MSTFIGGTILRIIMNYSVDYSHAAPGAFDTGFANEHYGLFLTEDTGPATSIWNPNTPFGDFMIRWSSDVIMSIDADAFADRWYALGPPPFSNGPANQLETAVKRRIRENSRLFIAMHHFEDATLVTGVAVGYTGRILIQLP